MDLFSRTPKAPISIIFCLIISFLVTTASAAPGLEWDSEIVYDPIYFRIGQQSLLYDASNTPHVFFGADNLYHSSYDGEKWVRETVDTNPRVGGNVAATMDSEGYFHIVYDDSASQDIDRTYYATNRSGSWVIETLPPEIRARWIAVDSKNKAHLVSTSKDNKLYSVAKTDSNWKSTHLSDRVGFLSSSSTLPEVSMTVDSNDIVHILYSRRSEDGVTTNDNEVVHTFGTGEQWSEEIIQKSEGHFTNYHYNSITVDINNKLHLVFAGAGSLNYATNKTGDWITETVDPEGYYEKYPSIEVDDSGTIYISYLNQLSSYPNLQLKLLTKTTDGWSTEVLDEGYVWGVNTDLALDINQRIHVVTYHSDSSSIHLFSQNDRIWSKEVVEKSNEPEGGIGNIESLPATGMYPSIAYDSDNSTYVAYFRSGDITHSSIEHGSELLISNNKSGNGWSTEIIDWNPYGFGYVSNRFHNIALAIDNQFKVHLLVAEHDFLFYASNKSGEWVIERLTNEFRRLPVGNKNYALKIDGAGAAHIFYYELGVFSDDPSFLNYITNKSGLWEEFTMEEIVPKKGYEVPKQYAIDFQLLENGDLSVGYLDGLGFLRSGRYSSGVWESHIVLEKSFDYRWGDSDIAVRNDGSIDMAYSRAECFGIACIPVKVEHGHYNGDIWQYQVVDYCGFIEGLVRETPRDIELSVDIAGNPNISYICKQNSRQGAHKVLRSVVRYARKPINQWRSVTIDENTLDARFNTIGTDSSGKVSIVYHDTLLAVPIIARSKEVNSPLLDVTFESGDSLVFVNTPEGSQSTREIVLQNIGNELLNINSIGFYGEEKSVSLFSLNPTSGPTACSDLNGIELAPGEKCTVILKFSPTSVQKHKILLTLSSNDGELPSMAFLVEASSINKSQEKSSDLDNSSKDDTMIGAYSWATLLLLSLLLGIARSHRIVRQSGHISSLFTQIKI